MDILETLRTALTPIVPEFHPSSYVGDAKEYIVANYTELPIFFGDDEPQALRYLIQVHWYFPLGKNPYTQKRQIMAAISGTGCTFPQVITASADANTRHLVFETEYCDGLV